MSTPESTWDTGIAAAEANQPPPTGNNPVSEPVVDPPVVEAAPEPAAEQAETPNTAEVESITDPAAREAQPQAVQPSEEKPDDDIQEGDTDEIKALPRGQARRWARNKARDAQLSEKYLGTEPISAIAEDLYTKSPSRYSELAFDIIQNTFGMPYEAVKAKLESANGNGEVKSQLEPSLNPDDPQNDPDVPDYVKEILAADKAAKDALTKQVEELGGKVSTIEQTEAQRQAEARQTKVDQIETELLRSVLTVVPEGIKSYGLEVSEKDPPAIAGLKQLASFYLMANVEGVFNESPDNVKATERAKEYAKRLERDNAFREEDALKVRTRAALDKVKERPEVKAVFDAIKTITEHQAKQIASRGLTTPGAPASSASAPLDTQGQLTGGISEMWEQSIERASVAS